MNQAFWLGILVTNSLMHGGAKQVNEGRKRKMENADGFTIASMMMTALMEYDLSQIVQTGLLTPLQDAVGVTTVGAAGATAAIKSARVARRARLKRTTILLEKEQASVARDLAIRYPAIEYVAEGF